MRPIILMSEPAVLDWDRIVHKNVRSSDGQDAGNVDAIDADSVVIITDGARKEYKISKSQVDGFNGAEVFLKLSFGELCERTCDCNKLWNVDKPYMPYCGCCKLVQGHKKMLFHHFAIQYLRAIPQDFTSL